MLVSMSAATTTLTISTPSWRSIFSVVTPKWREPTRVIRMGGLSILGRVSGPDVTRRRSVPRRPKGEQQVINSGGDGMDTKTGRRESRAVGSIKAPANFVPHLV